MKKDNNSQISGNSKEQLTIPITYLYNDYEITVDVQRYSNLKAIRKAIENKIGISIKPMRLIFEGHNLLDEPENTKILDRFGSINALSLVLQHKDGTDDSFIMEFERRFVNPSNNQSNSQNNFHKGKRLNELKPRYTDPRYMPQYIDRPVCNYDNVNEATYICLKCGQYWCEHCLKFEVHKKDLCEIANLEKTLQYKRDCLLQELGNKVTNDAYFPKLEKLEFLLNEKISIIDKQFNDMVNYINKIRESQMKFIIDYFYNKLNNKKFTSLLKDTDFFTKQIREIQNTFDITAVDINVKNAQTLNTGLEIIIDKFEDFKLQFIDFDNICVQYEHFNQTFLSQIEAKMNQSADVGRKIQNPEHLNKENEFIEHIDVTYSEKLKNTALIKIKYYNSIMIWNHINQKLIRINEFKDKDEFKKNYQVYAGNIFLNLKNILYIITGLHFNMFYFYDPKLNEVIRLPSLKDNHCRGGMIYIEFYNSIFCISGKYTNKVEYFNFQALKQAKRQLADSAKDSNSVLSGNNQCVNLFTNKDIKWEDFASLNVSRYYASFYVHNNTYLYVFMGYNQMKGYVDSIERIDLKEPEKFELVKFSNPKNIELKRNSMAVCYANSDEIYLLGGCVKDKYTDDILKYNFKQNTFYKTNFIIPTLRENEYFRFWEESTFVSLTSKGNTTNADDDCTFGMIDAKDKVHLFNVKTFKYNII